MDLNAIPCGRADVGVCVRGLEGVLMLDMRGRGGEGGLTYPFSSHFLEQNTVCLSWTPWPARMVQRVQQKMFFVLGASPQTAHGGSAYNSSGAFC